MNKKFCFALTAFVLSALGLFYILISKNSLLYFTFSGSNYSILEKYIGIECRGLEYQLHVLLWIMISGLSLVAMISLIFVIMFTLDKKEIEYKGAISSLLKKKWLIVLLAIYLLAILAIVILSCSVDMFTFQQNPDMNEACNTLVYRVMPIGSCLVNLICIISFYVYILKFRNNKLKEIV